MAAMIGREDKAAAERAKSAIGAAMERDVAESRYSLHEVAWKLGLSDEDPDGTKSLATLYKVVRGDRKFPHWLWGLWRRLTGGLYAVDAICREAGGVFVAMPDAKSTDEKALIRAIGEFSELTQKIAEFRLVTSEGGNGISQTEAERIQQAAFDSIRATLELIERFRPEPVKPKSQYAGSLQEAARMQTRGGTDHDDSRST